MQFKSNPIKIKSNLNNIESNQNSNKTKANQIKIQIKLYQPIQNKAKPIKEKKQSNNHNYSSVRLIIFHNDSCLHLHCHSLHPFHTSDSWSSWTKQTLLMTGRIQISLTQLEGIDLVSFVFIKAKVAFLCCISVLDSDFANSSLYSCRTLSEIGWHYSMPCNGFHHAESEIEDFAKQFSADSSVPR